MQTPHPRATDARSRGIKFPISGKVISAGFCQIDLETGNICVFGKSDTLKVESRLEDAEIIHRELNRWKTDY